MAEGALTRRDGFLLIWESIRRPAYETSKEPFADVGRGERGFLEITYAKRRGVLDDEAFFRPYEPMILEDAVLWMFRTRNVADLPDMGREDLGKLLARYPMTDTPLDIGKTVTQGELLALMRALDTALMEEVHKVSLYAEDFHGKGTAFGETFDMHAITAAHRTLPYNTLVKVTNMENGKSVIVRINDRGPYVNGRDMDLSLASFMSIAPRSRGVIEAKFQRLGDRELVNLDLCSGEQRRYQKRITRNIRFHRGVPHRFTVGEELVLQANKYFVLRGITYPDGKFVRMQDWVSEDEKFFFTPSIEGRYVFIVGTADGRQREMRMTVGKCSG